jgi:probable rRNA maturation factor
MSLVHFENRVGRAGVPTRRSFEAWVDAALPAKKSRRDEISIALLDSRSARAMNAEFRGKDYATNVLSFAFEPMPGRPSRTLGDVVLCPAVIAREAREQGKPLRHHYAHLTVHGVLHLLGYDHQDENRAARMEAIERRILAGLSIADPYADET